MCSECLPEECGRDPDGSVYVDRADFEWLIEKARLGLELDAFCTTQADRDRLTRITSSS